MCDQQRLMTFKKFAMAKTPQPFINIYPYEKDIEKILEHYRQINQKQKTQVSMEPIKNKEYCYMRNMKRVILNSFNKAQMNHSVGKRKQSLIIDKQFLQIKNFNLITTPNSPKTIKFTPRGRLQSLKKPSSERYTMAQSIDTNSITGWTRKTSESI